MSNLSCFMAYDIRGEIGVNIDENVCYRIGRAVAQHFQAENIVIGYDARKTSSTFAAATAQGITDAGSNVLDLGMAGTEEMYWAVTEFGACAGIEVTASHNPINYNGMKIVKFGSKPLDEKMDFQKIKSLANFQKWEAKSNVGSIKNICTQAREKYIQQILKFVNLSKLRPLKVVINSGNGAAGPTVDKICEKLMEFRAPIDIIHILPKPDGSFPNGIPNPLLPENHPITSKAVINEKADMGIAFDGDFDRCFFFDENGKFIPSEYIVGLLSSIFIDREDSVKIIHDSRILFNTRDIVDSKGAVGIQSKTGHAFVKHAMRKHDAVYGGEVSAHHYFRDFCYCDSGMIPWLMVIQEVSETKRSLGELMKKRMQAYPSSGEINFVVDNADIAIERVRKAYLGKRASIDKTDGLSIEFENWRFNIRKSNTEALIRLNLETKGNSENIMSKIKKIETLIGGSRV